MWIITYSIPHFRDQSRFSVEIKNLTLALLGNNFSIAAILQFILSKLLTLS